MLRKRYTYRDFSPSYCPKEHRPTVNMFHKLERDKRDKYFKGGLNYVSLTMEFDMIVHKT